MGAARVVLVVSLALVGAGCIVPSTGPSTPPPTTPVTVTTHRYGPLPEQVVDLYRPVVDDGEPVPVVVWVHGGAWVTGNRSMVPGVVRALPQAGIAVASIDYRLADPDVPESAFPAQVVDVKTAASWLVSRATELGLDGQSIAVAGESAGALVGVLAATTFGVADLSPMLGGEVRVVGAVAIAGPQRTALFLGGPYDQAVRTFLACPLQGPCPNATLADSSGFFDAADPPLLGIYGEADFVVPPEMGADQHQAAVAAGITSTFVVVPGAGHETVGDLADFPRLVDWLSERMVGPDPG